MVPFARSEILAAVARQPGAADVLRQNRADLPEQ